MARNHFILFVILLFVFRLIYGLTSEFWFEDELQIYLIGLKSFTTVSWPYFGPDVVYTNSQIPGALQGLLVAIPLFVVHLPESPIILLNILTFSSLAFFAWYISKRFPEIPKWMVWVWIMIAPWTINFGTRVVNPSYILIFSIPFFVCFFEFFENNNRTIGDKVCWFVLGISTTMIMQLHLSWVLLVPFIGVVFYLVFNNNKSLLIKGSLLFFLGIVIGSLTLLPTFFQNEISSKSVSSNIVWNFDNYKNIITLFTRYLAFASYEVPYWLGANTEIRLDVIKSHIWMAPFAIYVLLFGFAQVSLFVVAFFRKDKSESWIKIKWLTFATFTMVFVSFFFSIKNPSSHTFFIVMPIPMFYSFYCYDWIFSQKKIWSQLFKIALISGILFNVGLILYHFKNNSLYRDRERVLDAIEKKNYKILGERRSDHWGYGY